MTLAIAAVMFAMLQTTLAADLPASSAESSEAACSEIKTALRALASAEHSEALALDLAASGGNSAAIVLARLSVVLDRAQDLRGALKRARHSGVAREPMVEQCTRMGFRALVISEKLSSDVETVLFGEGDFVAQAPELKSDSAAPAVALPAPQP